MSDLDRIYERFVTASLENGRWQDDLSAQEQALLSLIPPGCRVLTVGPGWGREIDRLLGMDCSVWALDPCAASMRILSQRFGSRVRAIRGRLGVDPSPPFRATFDVLVALGNVLGGLLDMQCVRRFAVQALGLLEPEGLLLMDAWIRSSTDPGIERFSYPLGPGLTVLGISYRPLQEELVELLKGTGARFRVLDLDEDRRAVIASPAGELPGLSWPAPSSRSSWGRGSGLPR